MHKKSGIIVGMSNETIAKKLLSLTSRAVPFTLKAYAEEEDPENNTPPEDNNEGGDGAGGSKKSTVNFEDLITKARNEEKQKQYKKLEKLQGQIDTLTTQHNNDLLRVAELEKEIKELKEKLTSTGKDDSEAIKTLKKELETLEGVKKDLEKKVSDYEKNKPVSREDIEKEVRAELEAEYAVKTHRAEILAEHKDDLLVPELVMGSTVEELDTSLEAALARSKEITEKLGGDKGEKGKVPAKRTPKTPNNPSTDKVQDKGYTLDYLASLDVKSDEYKEVRKALGLR